jgi:hypothetical protein
MSQDAIHFHDDGPHPWPAVVPPRLQWATLTAGPRGSMGEEAACCAIDHGPGVDCAIAKAFAGIQWEREEVDRMCGLGEEPPHYWHLGERVTREEWERRGPVDLELLWIRELADRQAIEDINRRPAPAPVRLTPFGAEPWDLAAGEAA